MDNLEKFKQHLAQGQSRDTGNIEHKDNLETQATLSTRTM